MYANNEMYINDIKRIDKSYLSNFADKIVFITGGSGLVGSFLIDTLMYLNKTHNYNIKVYATFSNSKSLSKRFKSYSKEDLFFPIIQDINNEINLDINPDFIFHTASNTHPALYANKPVETMKLNFTGTNNILEFAFKSNAGRVIFLSTMEVYGEDENIDKFSENNIGYVNFMIPRSCYPVSKRACETLCHSYIKEYGIDTVIARLGYIYGPTVKLNSSKADVQFLNKALEGENIILKSAGLQKRSYCYVGDAVSALMCIALKGTKGESYNIANENGNICLKDYAEILANIANVKVEYGKAGEIETQGGCKVKNSTLNTDKLLGIGFEPEFDIIEGIKHTFLIKKGIQKECIATNS